MAPRLAPARRRSPGPLRDAAVLLGALALVGLVGGWVAFRFGAERYQAGWTAAPGHAEAAQANEAGYLAGLAVGRREAFAELGRAAVDRPCMHEGHTARCLVLVPDGS